MTAMAHADQIAEQQPISAQLKIIRMDALVLMPENQIRAETNYRTVKEYRELMASDVKFPAIKVTQVDPKDETKGYLLIDGWHRVAATRGLGWATVEAEVVPMKPEEYRWAAVEANRRHGLKLNSKDKRNCFRAYIEAGQHRKGVMYKSIRQMEKELTGIVSRFTLPLWLQQDFPSVFRAMRFGEDETAGNANIGATEKMDKNLQTSAEAALQEFLACVRGLSDQRIAWELARSVATVATEVSEAVSGKREWPKAAKDLTTEF